MQDNRQFTLKPYRASRKNWDHFKTFGAAVTFPIPHKIIFFGPILNQGNTEKCTAYTSVSIRESMKGKSYDPDTFWNDETAIGGTSSQGSSLETAAAVGVKTGFNPKGSNDRTDKASAYLFLNKRYGLDWFDSIKTTISQMQSPLSAGLLWFQEWDNTEQGIIPHTFNQVLGLHNTEIAGFTDTAIPEIGFLNPTGVDYLVVKGSWGEGFGLKGYFFFDREMANKVFNQGIFYWSDTQVDSVKKMGLISALLQNIVNLLRQLITQSNNPPVITPDQSDVEPVKLTPMDKILTWARAIQKEEGWNPESRSYRNKNPGNLKFTSLTFSLGASSKDKDGFCIFLDEDKGIEALCGFLKLACTDQLKAFHDARTLRQFTKVYAQPPNDNYANNVAKALNVKVDIDIKELL